MASVTDPRTGTCSTDDLVEAERRPPKLTFLFIVTGSTRSLVKRKPSGTKAATSKARRVTR